MSAAGPCLAAPILASDSGVFTVGKQKNRLLNIQRWRQVFVLPSSSASASQSSSKRSRRQSLETHSKIKESSSSTSPSLSSSSSSSQPSSSTTPDKIEFHHRGDEWFWLSPESQHSVIYLGERYATAEHLFQSLKFLNHRPDIVLKIQKTSHPLDAIRVARIHSKDVQTGWIRDRINVFTMKQVLELKFNQHPQLAKQLIQTKNIGLVYKSPSDRFWGIGNGTGNNQLGKILEEIRSRLVTTITSLTSSSS